MEAIAIAQPQVIGWQPNRPAHQTATQFQELSEEIKALLAIYF
jgi:hypothetical protein